MHLENARRIERLNALHWRDGKSRGFGKFFSCADRRACAFHHTSAHTRVSHPPKSATMGLTFTKLFNKLFSKKEMRILMVRWGVFPGNFVREKFGIRCVARDR